MNIDLLQPAKLYLQRWGTKETEMFTVNVFGTNLYQTENKEIAMRYAQAIRKGLWQCAITGEPWEHVKSNDMKHHHNQECLDSRTDDEVFVIDDTNIPKPKKVGG